MTPGNNCTPLKRWQKCANSSRTVVLTDERIAFFEINPLHKRGFLILN